MSPWVHKSVKLRHANDAVYLFLGLLLVRNKVVVIVGFNPLCSTPLPPHTHMHTPFLWRDFLQ